MSPRTFLLLALLAAPAAAAAQTATPAAEAAPPTAARSVGPPVQRIETATAVSTEPLGMQLTVRELADGRVLVNDMMRRRLLIMDTTMAVASVVLDSMTHVANAYGTQIGALLPYAADSTLFVDRASLAMVVIDPDGRPVRTRAVWRVQDLGHFASPLGAASRIGVDTRGRVVYRVTESQGPFVLTSSIPAGRGMTREPDSAFVVAVDVATRQRDTLAMLRLPRAASIQSRAAEGFYFSSQAINPLPQTDEWAVLADGTLAVVRGVDYSVEYIGADGSRSAPVRVPFDWQRIPDEQKDRMVDSVRTAAERNAMQQFVSQTIMWANFAKRPYPPALIVPDWYTPQPGFGRDWTLPEGLKLPDDYLYGCAEGEQPKPTESGRPSCVVMPPMFMGFGGGGMPQPTLREIAVIPADELPDYRPAFLPGAVRADGDGNLWIQTNPVRPVPGGPVFDVVDRQGQLVNRLQLPPGYTLVGFGRGKVVYLLMRDASGGKLARVRLR